jgi:hypothetical protein
VLGGGGGASLGALLGLVKICTIIHTVLVWPMLFIINPHYIHECSLTSWFKNISHLSTSCERLLLDKEALRKLEQSCLQCGSMFPFLSWGGGLVGCPMHYTKHLLKCAPHYSSLTHTNSYMLKHFFLSIVFKISLSFDFSYIKQTLSFYKVVKDFINHIHMVMGLKKIFMSFIFLILKIYT